MPPILAWLLHNLTLVVAVLAVINFVRVLLRVRRGLRGAAEARRDTSRRIGGEDPDQVERARQIRAEILRKIADRQGHPAPADPSAPTLRADRGLPSPASSAPPLELPRRLQETWRRATVPPIDTFGGPVARPARREPAAGVGEPADESGTAGRAGPVSPALPPVLASAARAFRPLPPRRDAIPVPVTLPVEARAGTEGTPRPADLRDPAALRRAMVLREILGAPVALR